MEKFQPPLMSPLVEKFEETVQTTKKWYEEAQSAMKKATGATKPSLEDISFKSAKDVQQHVKDADTIILKVIKEQKNAAKAAA